MNTDWDRHWDTMCLGIITIATAVMGAAFFAADIASISFASKELEARMMEFIKIAPVFIVLLVYLRMVLVARKSIFTASADLERAGTSKREQTAYVFEGFIIIVGLLILLLALNMLTDLAAASG